jgi:hypothetical protein
MWSKDLITKLVLRDNGENVPEVPAMGRLEQETVTPTPVIITN